MQCCVTKLFATWEWEFGARMKHEYKTTNFVKSKFYYFDEDTFSVDKKGKFECKRLSKTMPAVTICMTHLFLRDRGNSSSAIIWPAKFLSTPSNLIKLCDCESQNWVTFPLKLFYFAENHHYRHHCSDHALKASLSIIRLNCPLIIIKSLKSIIFSYRGSSPHTQTAWQPEIKSKY